MASRRALRERFDDGTTPEPLLPPRTHRCDCYLATDAAMVGRRTGLGAVLESADGERIAHWQRPGHAPDNNAAELQALHFGLDRLARREEPPIRLGVLLDHDAIASAVAACVTPGVPAPIRPPTRHGSPHHWGGIRARLAHVPSVRVAIVDGRSNPAHRLANGVAAD